MTGPAALFAQAGFKACSSSGLIGSPRPAFSHVVGGHEAGIVGGIGIEAARGQQPRERAFGVVVENLLQRGAGRGSGVERCSATIWAWAQAHDWSRSGKVFNGAGDRRQRAAAGWF